MRYGRHGFTLMELLVTIAILVVVMALLVFPIFSGYGYVQKAQARIAAQSAGDEAVQKLKKDLSTAAYVFDIPPDGTSLTFLQADEEGNATVSGDTLRLVQYAQKLDDPFGKDVSANRSDDYPWEKYAPFWRPGTKAGEENPFILGRLAKNATWDEGRDISQDLQYPEKLITDTDRSMKKQKYRNQMIAVTPLGARWDVPRFQVTPMRVILESLPMQIDAHGRKDPTVVIARYPLWAGRNRMLDEAAARGNAALAAVWPLYQLDSEANFMTQYGDVLQLYPKEWNPFGYEVRVFDEDGGLRYGISDSGGVTCERHFMDWPPMGRSDWTSGLWTKTDIERQRLEGKLVFAQPMLGGKMGMSNAFQYTDDDNVTQQCTGGYLPVPAGWDPLSETTRTMTYLVARPSRITCSAGTFVRVERPSDLSKLHANEFCFLYDDYRLLDWKHDTGWQWKTRAVAFGSAMPTGVVDISAKYSICDLQPTDVVVATYSTKGVLDVALTVARRDSATKVGVNKRQEYTANLRVTLRSAVAHARSSQ